MAKVTRIIYSKDLNRGKYEQLEEMARRLGDVRKEVWHRYGSIAGVGISHRAIRDAWLAEGREFELPARIWKATLADVMGDIAAYREAAKIKVRRAIWARTSNEAERKRLFTLLKYDRWLEDSFLRRQMRKYWRHGKTDVANQIVLDMQCYKAFEHHGQGWIEVAGLVPRKRIAIPLNTTAPPTGTIRLILRDGRVEVHWAIEENQVTVTRPTGDKTLGIDKGYTEVFTDSDGDRHGEGLGEILSAESDYLKVKYQKRDKLRQIARKKAHKRDKIHRHNLGRKKLDRRKRKHTARVRDKVFKATHSVVDKASTVVTEDLTGSFNGKSHGKNQNRRLAGWVKGIEAEAIELVSRRRGSTMVIVNAAYTSQMDSRYGILLGERSGDKFYGFDGVVLDADTNAARNVLARLDDPEIQVYQPHTQVKTILLKRTAAFKKRVGNCSTQDSSCSRRSW